MLISSVSLRQRRTEPSPSTLTRFCCDTNTVLPGGPGTWDELWEMACSRNLGLTKLPIVCVSGADGYYDNFRSMLERAYREGLVKNKPEDVVHFVEYAEDAVRWVESRVADASSIQTLSKVKARKKVLRSGSIFAPPTFLRSVSWISDTSNEEGGLLTNLWSMDWTPALTFSVGIVVGLTAATHFTQKV